MVWETSPWVTPQVYSMSLLLLGSVCLNDVQVQLVIIAQHEVEQPDILEGINGLWWEFVYGIFKYISENLWV